MEDHQDSATPPSSGIPTQPRVNRHLDADEILTAFASIRDSLMASAGMNKDRESSRAGKNIIYNVDILCDHVVKENGVRKRESGVLVNFVISYFEKFPTIFTFTFQYLGHPSR